MYENGGGIHMAQILDYAKNGYSIVKTYSDEALSGFLDANKIEGLNDLITDAKRFYFSYVLVWNFERLARKRKIMLELREFLEEVILKEIRNEFEKALQDIARFTEEMNKRLAEESNYLGIRLLEEEIVDAV